MEHIEPIETTEGAILPSSPGEPTWDPEKAAKRKVRVLKVPYDQDPMKEKSIFEYQGFVYICYAKKTRGRSMIRCLGIANVERPREKKNTPFEEGKILDEATKELDGDTFGDAISGDGIKDAIDKIVLDKVIKEAINDETVQQVIKEVTGDGQSRGSDETPNP